MKKAIIHIGSPKTGSTSIQQALCNYNNKENSSLFDYPVVESFGHQNIVSLLTDNVPRSVSSKLKNKGISLKAYREEFAGSLESQLSDSNHLVLSSEYLWSLEEKEIKLLKHSLEKKGFSEFLVVMYIRNPADYYLSMIQQKLKASSKIVDPFRFRYKALSAVENWSAVFGNVFLESFEMAKGKGISLSFSNIVGDFFDSPVSFENIRTNEGLSSEALVFLQKIRSSLDGFEDDVLDYKGRRLVALLAKFNSFGKKPKLKYHIKQHIYLNHVDDFMLLKEVYELPMTLDFHGLESMESSGSNVFKNSVQEVLEEVDDEVVMSFLVKVFPHMAV